MQKHQNLMPKLEQIKNILQNYFKSKPIEKAWIFGSYARGEESTTSDIDILVDFDKDNYPSLLKHIRIIHEIEDLTGVKIDLVPNDSLYDAIRPAVDKDKILVYERS